MKRATREGRSFHSETSKWHLLKRLACILHGSELFEDHQSIEGLGSWNIQMVRRESNRLVLLGSQVGIKDACAGMALKEGGKERPILKLELTERGGIVN